MFHWSMWDSIIAVNHYYQAKPARVLEIRAAVAHRDP